MEEEKAIVEAFRKNRVGVKIVEKYEGCSKIEYVLERLTGGDISENKVKRITADMTSLLSFVPEVDISPIFEEISVIVRNPSPEVLDYSKKEELLTPFDVENETPFTFSAGSDAIEYDLRSYNLKEYTPVLIYGDDGYGKTNLIKVLLEEYKNKEYFSFIIGDSLAKGEYDSRLSDPCYTVIKKKEEIIGALSNLKNEIKSREEFLKTIKKEHRDATEEEKKRFGALVFVIDDYTALLDSPKDENEIKKITDYVSRKGYKVDVFLILSSAVISDIFRGEEQTLFKSIVSFRCENPDNNYLSSEVDYFNIPLYYPGDALIYDVNFQGGDRVQCFKLEE